MDILDKFVRWQTGRGFGVQSPSAYSFIRYVIKERYPYYIYSDLRKVYQDIGNNRRLQLELFFRLVNFWQPITIYIHEHDNIFNRYINAGCKNTEIVNSFSNLGFMDENHIIILDSIDGTLLKAIEFANEKTMIIVEGINESELWNTIVSSKKVIRSYDLVDIGILFFDDRKLKEHYRLSY